jgi:hypothetical protein
MRWQRLLNSAAAVVGAAAVGCGSTPPLHAADPGGPPATEVRTQKADAAPVTPASHNAVPQPPGPGRPVASVRALVNGIPILDDEVTEAAFAQLATLNAPTEEERKAEVKKIKAAALETLIERELLVQEAEHKLALIKKQDVLEKVRQEADEQFLIRVKKLRANFKSDEEFNAFMKARGTTLEEQKRIQRRVLISQQYLNSNIMRVVDQRTGHQEIYDYYRSHPEEFQRTDNVQWLDIFIDSSQYPSREAAYRVAQDVAARAKAGDADDFVKLCDKYDNGLAKTKKGAGIGTRREDIIPAEASAVLFQMRDGDVGPVVSVTTGFHVVRLVKRTYAGLALFNEETQKAIKDKLRNEAYVLESKHFVEGLKKTAHIERFPMAP